MSWRVSEMFTAKWSFAASRKAAEQRPHIAPGVSPSAPDFEDLLPLGRCLHEAFNMRRGGETTRITPIGCEFASSLACSSLTG
jgi:hypothetical protein